VAVGGSVGTSHGTDHELMPSAMPGGWETALPSGGKPALRAKCVKRMPSLKLVVYVASQTDWKSRALREQCLAKGGQRRPGASGQCSPPSLASACCCCAGAHRSWIDAALVDVAGRSLRRTWTARLSSAIGGGASISWVPATGQASSSSTPCAAFASSLERA
jgi:hypothetical protein